MVSSLHEVFDLWASEWVDLKFMDLGWILMGNILNAHTSSLGVNENWASTSSVQSDTQVHFLVNLEFFNKIDSLHLQTVLSRLLGDQMVSEHLAGNFLGLLSTVNDMDSTLEFSLLKVTESSSSSEDLGFDNATTWESFGNGVSFFGSSSSSSEWNSNSMFVKEGSSLVFVELYSSSWGVDHRSHSGSGHFSVDPGKHFYSI